ncbi:MAG: hypothetical protein ABI977_18685, partial [Acidobacteriota bacterium]
LFDLLVAEAQAEDVKGGCQNCGIKLNHNETAAEDEEVETESIEDLPVDDDEQVKGGRMLNNKNPELVR